jgi:rhodanese-related sulfurtransferase
VEVGKRLVELGYPNVHHYVEGKRGWVEAGLPLEGGGVRAP